MELGGFYWQVHGDQNLLRDIKIVNPRPNSAAPRLPL
jgi:hypothetical protein